MTMVVATILYLLGCPLAIYLGYEVNGQSFPEKLKDWWAVPFVALLWPALSVLVVVSFLCVVAEKAYMRLSGRWL